MLVRSDWDACHFIGGISPLWLVLKPHKSGWFVCQVRIHELQFLMLHRASPEKHDGQNMSKQPQHFLRVTLFSLLNVNHPILVEWLNPNWLMILILQGPGRWLHQDPLQGPNAQSLRVATLATLRGKGGGRAAAKKWLQRNLAEFLLFKL